LASRFLTVQPDVDHENRPGRFAALERWYSRNVNRVLDHRGKVFAGAAVLLVIALLGIPLIPFELAPQTDGDQIQVQMRMDDGTNIAVIYEYAQLLDAAVKEAVSPSDVVFMTKDIRNNRAAVELTLKQPGERSVTGFELADRIRAHVANTIPGADIQVSAQSGLFILRRLFQRGGSANGGASLQIELRGYDLDTAEQLGQDASRRIETLPGVQDVDATNRERRPQQNVTFDRERMSQLGVSVRDVAAAMQTSIGGRRAGVYRIGGEEI